MSEQKNENNKESYPIKNIVSPAFNDVMLGRGAGTNNHEGNKYFRKLVKQHQDAYIAAKNNFEKYLTTMEILNIIRSLEPPGRFILQDSSSKLWNDVGDDKARRKISQALRENASELRKGSENDSVETLDSKTDIDNEMKQSDFRLEHTFKRQNSINLNSNTNQSSTSFLGSSRQSTGSAKSMELSLSELEVLLHDFSSGHERKPTPPESNILDPDTSIGTFPVDDMSLSFGNFSTQLDSYPVY